MDIFIVFFHSCSSQYTMTFGADIKTARERIVVKRTKTTRQSLSMTCSVNISEITRAITPQSYHGGPLPLSCHIVVFLVLLYLVGNYQNLFVNFLKRKY